MIRQRRCGAWRRLAIATAGSALLLLAAPGLAADYQLGGAQFSFAEHNTDTVTDTYSICINKNDPKSCFTVSIKVKEEDQGKDKAGKLIAAIGGSQDPLAKKVKARLKKLNGKDVPDTIQILGAASISGSDIQSHQVDKLAAAGFIVPHDGGVVPGGTTGGFGFTGVLAGLASDGTTPSTFQASFAYGNVDAEVLLSYGALSSPTIDGVLSDMYQALLAQLPSGDQADLALDLPGGDITFDFPAGAQDPTVSVGSTDIGTNTSFGLAGIDVPEPPSLALLLAGAASVLARRRGISRRRP